MNLAIRGLAADLGKEPGDTFGNDQHPDTKFDYIIANPPFNISDWGGEKYEDDPRWVYGRPPVGNANYAWLQHMLWKLGPGGQAGVVLANGSMSSNTGGEGEIRKAMIEDDDLPDFSSVLLWGNHHLSYHRKASSRPDQGSQSCEASLKMPKVQGDPVNLLWMVPIFENERQSLSQTGPELLAEKIIGSGEFPVIGPRNLML